MTNWLFSYIFAIDLAIAALTTGCASDPVAPGDSSVPVMGRLDDVPSVSPKSAPEKLEITDKQNHQFATKEAEQFAHVKVSRAHIRFQALPEKGKILVFQRVTWADGLDARTLAGLWVNTQAPLEIVVLDNLTPPPRIAAAEPGHSFPSQQSAWLDEYFGAKTLRIRPTPQFVPFFAPNQELTFACDEGEVRALARIHAPEYVHLRQTLPGKTPREYFLFSNAVCLRFDNT